MIVVGDVHMDPSDTLIQSVAIVAILDQADSNFDLGSEYYSESSDAYLGCMRDLSFSWSSEWD